jgi:hypothetical protein
MGTDESQILAFLKTVKEVFVSATEIARRADNRQRYDTDRWWAKPVLKHLEGDGLVESNADGDYRLKQQGQQRLTFTEANRMAKPLGDTDIILLEDVDDTSRPGRSS